MIEIMILSYSPLAYDMHVPCTRETACKSDVREKRENRTHDLQFLHACNYVSSVED